MVSKFKKEFKKQIRLAIAASVGFIIAYSWRDFIVVSVKSLVGENFFINNQNIINLSSALILTFIGVVIIFISSKILKE